MHEKYNSPSEETTEKQQEAIKENDKAQLETPRRKNTNPHEIRITSEPPP